MVFVASCIDDNHTDHNLKEAEAGKSRYSLLFFLPRAKNGAIRKKSQVYRSASGEVVIAVSDLYNRKPGLLGERSLYDILAGRGSCLHCVVDGM
jgi:hypothetical protein